MTAFNFPNSPSNNSTETVDGTTYTYSSAKSAWVPSLPSASGGITVYSSLSQLPSGSSGDMALIPNAADSEQQFLYIHNGSGWFKVALINSTPTWSTAPPSAVALNIDGTATVITIVATDPEGLAITYSATTSGLGSIATVVQGTGSNANQFTITPSTDSANAGTFSITFRATDQINNRDGITTFTLAFISPFWKNVSLSTGTSSVPDNKTFIDRSSNAYTVTPSGNPIQGTFNPYGTVWSYRFTAEGNRLAFPYNTAHADFHLTNNTNLTFEAWYFFTSYIPYNTGTSSYLVDFRNASNTSAVHLYITPSGSNLGKIKTSNGQTGSTEYSTNVVPLNEWLHFVFDKNGTTGKVYINGVLEMNISDNVRFAGAGGITVGARYVQEPGYYHYSMKGYVSNIRVSNTQRYADATAALAAYNAKEIFTLDSDTKLLVNKNRFVDSSSSAHTVQINGTPFIYTFPVVPFLSKTK